jgi:HPt (histidine-containing phosphotransfer) domain-containing protein
MGAFIPSARPVSRRNRLWPLERGKFRAVAVDDSAMREDDSQPAPLHPEGGHTPLRSRFADDPEMRELVLWFLGDLERRVSAIRSALDTHDAARLRVLAHQLSGSATGYGFEEIGEAARRVESEIRFITLHREASPAADDGLEDEVQISTLAEKTEDLISVCRRAIDGKRGAA